ncbi:DNA methyltransferase [Helicobacter sp. MIT 01-3238]|uniref:DNA methyltransferase n=1 Tax=Helicobacter sp. MIT 01-3238 TaxID=398627 RepID=UPI0026988277
MDYKKAFYSKLEDCYLGAKVKEVSANKETKVAKESNTNSAFANSQASSSDSSTKSGFTNLLHIKEQYFAHIKAHLQSRIKALIGNDTIESKDIYNKLYTFFDSYLNETGTPFFTDTPIYKNIYAKIYSNSKDTSLFYKTQNLYYVKSDTLYQSLILQNNAEKDSEGRFSIFFDASEYKQNADNSKNKVIFKLDCITNGALNSTHPLAPSAEGGGTIELHSASEGEQEDNLSIPQITIKVTNQKDLFPDSFNVFKSNSNEFSDDFIKALSDNNLLPKKPTDSHIESLKKLFSSYKKQNEIDFFIHKNAKEFLQEQFDLWMFSYLYKDSAFQQWEEVSIKRLQNVKNLAYEIIDFIVAFEEELKAIWLKPKFAKNTQYVFSINTILSNATNANALLAKIFSDSHFESQVKEWKELNLVGEDFALSSLQGNEAIQALQNDKYKFLPIDTKHLSKESRFALLSAFSDLESLLNGELIKSDNFQALNSIMPKYQGKIDLIYIDPPFNLGENASFDYKVNFKDSTWASLLDSRLELANQILNNKGSIFVRCDYNGNFIVRSLLNNIFGDDNFINEIVVSKSAKLTETIKKYHSGSDSLFFFGKTNDCIFNVQGIQREERKWRDMHLPGERWSPIPNDYIHLFSQDNLVIKNGKYTSKARIILGKELLPPNGRHWALSQETIFELEK